MEWEAAPSAQHMAPELRNPAKTCREMGAGNPGGISCLPLLQGFLQNVGCSSKGHWRRNSRGVRRLGAKPEAASGGALVFESQLRFPNAQFFQQGLGQGKAQSRKLELATGWWK